MRVVRIERLDFPLRGDEKRGTGVGFEDVRPNLSETAQIRLRKEDVKFQ